MNAIIPESATIVVPNVRSKFTIRTSDRRVFRRCLRKWDHTSSLRQNLASVGSEQNINFWFGSAIHFALEDYHGYNRFKDPRRALYAYYHAFKSDDLPMGADACYELGIAMLSYYLTWHERHNEQPGFTTIWFDDKMNVVQPFTPGATPAVEQSFNIPLDIQVITDAVTDTIYAVYTPGAEYRQGTYDTGYLTKKVINALYGDDNVVEIDGEPIEEYVWTDTTGVKHPVNLVPIYYHGTMDKLVIDRFGRWWIADYKTAKGADTNKLDTDDQISAYCWAAELWFKHPIYGFVYIQLTKDKVQAPKRLKSGELSVDKKQKTTYGLLKQELIADFGSVQAAPSKLIQFLNALAEKETPEGDRFVRWDFVTRDRNQIESTYENIMGEVRMMLSKDLYCYPNPTRDCIWDCPFRDMCVAIDKKDDILVRELMLQWKQRPRTEDGNIDDWRKDIVWPESDEDLVSMETIMQTAEELNIELNENPEDAPGFQFAYEEEC